MRFLTAALFALPGLSAVQAIKLSVSLPSSHAAALSSSSIGTSAVFHSSPSVRAPLSSRGDFIFDLSKLSSEISQSDSDRYLVDVYSKQYVFAPLLVALDKTGDVKGVWEVRRGEAWGEKGEGMRELDVKKDGDVRFVSARVIAARDYYEVRQGFSPLALLKSPMILLAVFAMAMAFGLPYLIDNMDPETRAEFEAAQKQGGIASLIPGGASASPSGPDSRKDRSDSPAPAPPINPANFDLAGWMAGQQTKMSGAGSATEGKGKTSGSDVKAGGSARRRG